MLDAHVLEIRLLRQEVRDLIESQDAMLRQLMTRSDRRAGVELFPLVAAAIGEGVAFDLGILAARVVNDMTPTGLALQALIEEQSTEAGGLRAFGRLLERLDGVPLAGYRLCPAGQGRDGRRWKVVRVSRP